MGAEGCALPDWRATNTEVVQSGPRVWIKDVYRVGPPKQVRPQNGYGEKEKT